MPISDLDQKQKKAAVARTEEVAVSAGAGSGKTRILVTRYLYFAMTEDAPLSSLVAITFTNKAANQLKARISEKARELAAANGNNHEKWRELAENIHHAPISTIHSFCSSILRTHPVEAGIDPFFTIIDEVTNAELKIETVDRFIASRMAAAPHEIAFLSDVFGMRRLKKILRILLDSRTEVVKFLDSEKYYDEPRHLREHYRKSLLKRIDRDLGALLIFHAKRPADDSLAPVYDRLVEGYRTLKRMVENDEVESGYIERIMNGINLRKGSKNKWGDDLPKLKDALRECRDFLRILASFYDHEIDVTDRASSFLLREFSILEELLLEEKKARSCFDNDDLLIETWRLLRTNVKLCRKISSSIRHIMVDEFQDTDSLQMDILNMIAGNSSICLFTVGDPKQSIYRFRGADVTVFNTFILNSDFISLKMNYRSSPAVMAFINQVFSTIMGEEPQEQFEAPYAHMKTFRSDSPFSPAVEIAVIDGRDTDRRRVREAQHIARRAQELHTGIGGNTGLGYGEMALLLRKSTAVWYYEEAFLRAEIPFVNLAGGQLSDSPETYDIGNLLGYLSSPEDPVLLTAVLLSPFFSHNADTLYFLKRMAGTSENLPFLLFDPSQKHQLAAVEANAPADLVQSINILKQLLALRDRVTIRELLEYAFEETGYTLTLLADRITGERSLALIDLILDTADAFEMNGGSLHEFSALMLSGEPFTEESAHVESRGDVFTIMTIHRAKGLEFKAVFLADIAALTKSDSIAVVFDDEVGPGFKIRNSHGGTIDTFARWKFNETDRKKDIAESKRLFYVGCTRAKDHLLLSGSVPKGEPDPFYEKDNWMKWLHEALSLPWDGSDEDLSGELFQYTRLTDEHDQDVMAKDTDIIYWKSLCAKADTQRGTRAAPDTALLKPVPPVPLSHTPWHISTTDLVEYIMNATEVIDYRPALPGSVVAGRRSETPGIVYGSYAHAVLEAVDFGDPGSWRPLIDALAGHELTGELREQLYDDLLRFQETSTYQDLSRAREISREIPFSLICDDILIRGSIDLLYRNERDEHVIVDYKTDALGPNIPETTLEKHHLQVGIYALAVFRAQHTIPEKLIVYYLTPGIAHETPCSPDLLDDIEHTVVSALK